jgi:hypothetical protein
VTQPADRKPTIEPVRWPAPVLRVRLRWDGSAWIVDRVIRVERMTLPAPDELPKGDDSRGFWIEAVDRDGRVRHRQIMADPLGGMEQFDDKGLVTRMRHTLDKPSIEVLVPALDDLAELHIVSNPAGRPPGQDPHGHDRRQAPGRTRLTLPEQPKDHHDPHDDGGRGHEHEHGAARRPGGGDDDRRRK